MKYLLILFALVCLQTKNANAIRCEGGMLEEKVISSMEVLATQLEKTVTKETNPAMTEEEKIKGLIDLKCINAAYGEKGLKEFKDKILFRTEPLDGGHIGRFCNELGIDASTMREGGLNNLKYDSLAISRLRKEIIYACFPNSKFTIKDHVFSHSNRLEDDNYQKFATIITHDTDLDDNLADLVRYLFKVYPDIFSCKNNGSTTYRKGHFYINIFLANLYPLADYLLPELNGKKGSIASRISVLDALSDEDEKQLKEVLCEKKTWEMYEKDATRYLKAIFKNDECP